MRCGYRLPMIAGIGIAAAGLVLMTISPPVLSPYGWLAVAAGVVGVGLGMVLPASNNATLARAPGNTAAVAGLRGMFRQSGGITSISLITAVVARNAVPRLALAHSFLILAIVLGCLIPAVSWCLITAVNGKSGVIPAGLASAAPLPGRRQRPLINRPSGGSRLVRWSASRGHALLGILTDF